MPILRRETVRNAFTTLDDIGFAGDWHGNEPWAMIAMDYFFKKNVDFIYHLGDFGVWPGGKQYRANINTMLDINNAMMVVVLGNHENYDIVETWPLNRLGFIVEPDHHHIWYAPRGHVWMHNYATVCALGGAFSIDKFMRTEGRSWWPQEEITAENVLTLEKNLNKNYIYNVDLFLSHDIPAGLDVGKKKFALPPDLENESYRQRMILREAVDMSGVDFYGTEYKCNTIGLAEDGKLHGNVMTAMLVPSLGLIYIDIPTLSLEYNAHV
jgi:hypothetical protein